jgi:putative transposase
VRLSEAEKEVICVTNKIRVYPKNNKPLDCTFLARRAYNLAIDHFKNTPYETQLKLVELRRKIKEQVKLEFQDRYYEAEVAGESVRKAFLTRAAIIKKRKQGVQCDYQFKSIKETKQSYIKQRLNKSIGKMFDITESISPDSFGRTTTISLLSGRWFLNTISEVETQPSSENQGLRVASIDPGVRTFATVCYGNEYVKYGEDFHKDIIFPLALKMDKLLGLRAKHIQKYSEKKSQFFYDDLRFLNKKINKVKNRISDLINDLHRRVAFDLISKSDVILLPVILLPTFETKAMSRKIKRKIRSKTVRAMLGLSHYKFKLFLKWCAKKQGKLVLDVNEAYTSKTRSWSGVIDEKLGGSKLIKDDLISVDRDVNGARGILLRALSMGA